MNIKPRTNTLYNILIVLLDVFCTGVTTWLVSFCMSKLTAFSVGSTDVLIIYTACMIFMLYTYEFYTKLIRTRYEVVLSIGLSSLISTIVILVYQAIVYTSLSQYNTIFLVINMMVTAIVLAAEKLIQLSIRKRTRGVNRLLILERKEHDNSLARKIKYSYAEIYDAWYLQIDCNSSEEIEDVIHNKFPQYDGIFLSPYLPDDLRNYFISNAVSQQKEIYLLPDLYNISVMKNEMVSFDDTPALRIKPFGLNNMQKAIKRAFDVVFSLMAILLTSPIMLICAVLIRATSKGPAIYRQTRVTYHEQEFTIYKFRTMVADAEHITGATLAKENDPRITKVGRILRATRLDELPQLFNVLLGQMSVIGPRPERPVFVNKFKTEIENYDKRFLVKGGLTGLAQIYGRYSTSTQYKTLYDLLYIKDYSIWLDVKIILLTIKIMFVKASSSGVAPPPQYPQDLPKNQSTTSSLL